MNGYRREDSKRDLCKSHSVRTDREPNRVCPSKLSKRELEDLYFTVVENNIELKRTVNNQQEKIKALSTKVQRMTVAQRPAPARERECCSYIKAMVNEQKQSIVDLKKANERMSERIRVLNMRLCSAKQFLRRSPVASMSRCTKLTAPPTSLKNSSLCILHAKASDINARSAGVSSQNLDKDIVLSTRTVETETDEQEKEDTEKLCEENKCRCLIDELKQKIVDLQEELSKCHDEYSSRISRLEAEVTDLREDKERAAVQRVTSAQQLQRRGDQADQLAARLRAAEAQYGDLAMELSIEKRKVAELETRVKAVDMSCAVAKTIEEHLSNTNLKNNEIENQQLASSVSPDFSPRDKSTSRCGCGAQAGSARDDHKVSKLSDDSGFVGDSPNMDDEKARKPTNEELCDRITCLQEQLNNLRLSAKKSATKEGLKGVPSKALLSSRAASPPRVIDVPAVDSFTKHALEEASRRKSASNSNLKESFEREVYASNAVEPTVHSSPLHISQEGSNKPSRTVSIMSTAPRRLSIYFDETQDKSAKEMYMKVQSSESDAQDSNLVPCASQARRRRDSHNSMQIPGPLPVDDAVAGTSKFVERIRKKQRDNADRKSRKKDSIDSAMSHVREVVSLDLDAVDNGDANTFGGPLATDTKCQSKNIITGNSCDLDKLEKASESQEPVASQKKPVEEIEVSGTALTGISKDGYLIKVAGPSLIDKFMEDEVSYYVPTSQPVSKTEAPGPLAPATVPPEDVGAAALADARSEGNNDGPIEFCASYARACTCAGARRREVSVFRTCSGTLRFRTTPAVTSSAVTSPAGASPSAAAVTSPGAPVRLRHCGCAPPVLPTAAHATLTDRDTQTDQDTHTLDDKPRRRSCTYSKNGAQRTYSVPPRSPDNTDCEISTLTDLPSEKDGKSPRALSPGEQKPVSTYTESYSTPTTEYGTLSEGEMPGAGGGRKYSVGEAKVNFEDTSRVESRRMEAALAAIGEELARCRDLLQARRATQDKLCKDASQMADMCPGPIALRRAAASPRIGDAFTPKCVFTLHIGTVVLSDEAVISSRNMSLVLTWKFYDQNVTMTRMKTGRVVLFDFSTEYDLKITDQFLNYMKYDEMQLLICEIDNQWEPFASCALRLRDALLHTNRRADMSLALTAGPQLREARATRDDLDASDEVGVLDLWCMLRVDPALLPAINRAIAKSSPLTSNSGGAGGWADGGSPRGSRPARGSVTPDDHDDDHLSQDLDVHLKRAKYSDSRPVSDNDSLGSQTRREMPVVPSIFNIHMDRHPLATSTVGLQTHRYSTDTADNVNIAALPSHQRRKSQDAKSPLDPSDHVEFKQESDIRSSPSRIIANEVDTKIRSAYEMKQALDASQDAVSQTHSAGSSWRGLVTRRLIPSKSKRRSTISNVSNRIDEPRGPFPSFFKYYSRDAPRVSKCSKGYPAPVRLSMDIPEPSDLTRENASKKSVTYTDWDKDKTVYYDRDPSEEHLSQSIEITIMWLALNEECAAMTDPRVQRLYVAYAFLGRSGADLETPISLPKPASYVEKCFFHFSKTFQLNDCDLPLLGHMAKCRSTKKTNHDPKDCIIFSVISEPPEDPLGLDTCEDIGFAYLYLGDLLEYSAGSDSYTEVIPVLSARSGEAVCGVLSVKLDGLDVLRRCVQLAASQRDLPADV